MSEGWRESVKAGRYLEVDWMELPPLDKAAFLAALRAVVPLVSGRPARPSEIEGTEAEVGPLREAAQILALGELAAAVEGDMPTESEAWEVAEKEVLRLIEPYRNETGSIGLNGTPADHVHVVDEALTELQEMRRFYAGQATDAEDRRVIEEAIAEAARLGAIVGQHAQIALHTPFYQTFTGALEPLIAARDNVERVLRETTATAADRDAVAAELRQVVERLALLESRAVEMDFGRRKGGAVRQDKALRWQQRALELRQELHPARQGERPTKQATIAHDVALKLQAEGHTVSASTVESFFRSHDTKNPEA